MASTPVLITRNDHRQIEAWLAAASAETPNPATAGTWRTTLLQATVVGGHARLPGSFVAIGSPFDLEELDSGGRMRVRLVKPAETDEQAGHISVLSPLGTALLGRAEGDVVSCPNSGGPQRYRITHVFRDPLTIAAAAL